MAAAAGHAIYLAAGCSGIKSCGKHHSAQLGLDWGETQCVVGEEERELNSNWEFQLGHRMTSVKNVFKYTTAGELCLFAPSTYPGVAVWQKGSEG